MLQRLLRHFNQYSLRNADLYTPDVLGDAYEYLIKMFADDAGKKGGEFYTPKGVVKLIVRLIKPLPRNLVYYPTCGSGGMLIESAKYIAEQPEGKVGNTVNVSLFGQEKNLGTWAICKINMILHGFMEADIRKGDTLTDPKHKDDHNNLKLFDRVIANPMENSKKGHFNDHLRERTISLSISVYNLVQDKKLTLLVRPIVNQVIRSSSSVAANYRAATRARSDKEFYSKICIVVEECDETMLWIEYLVRTGLLTIEETDTIQKENEALLRIFTSTKKTMKDKLRL